MTRVNGKQEIVNILCPWSLTPATANAFTIVVDFFTTVFPSPSFFVLFKRMERSFTE